MRIARLLCLVLACCVLSASVGASVVLANDPPSITCPVLQDPGILCNYQLIDGGDGIFNLGDLVAGNAAASDPNGDPLTFSIISVTHDGQPDAPVNAPVIDNDGNFSWQTTGTDAEGLWHFCLEVSDGELTDTCCFDVQLSLTFYLSLRDVTGMTDTIPSLPGASVDAFVNVSPAAPLSALSVQFAYDDSAFFFQGPAMPINELADWEYFTYRLMSDTSCGGSGPMGLMSFKAVADLDNGVSVVPPESSFGLNGNIIKLRFMATGDFHYLGHCGPFNFCSVGCADNSLVSKDGTITYLPYGSDPGCLTGSTVEGIQTCAGRICLRYPDPTPCDINLNGIGPEIGDVILMINWFIHGDNVLDPPWIPFQKQNMDCNNDGVSGTFADLVYMIRIISGSISPFPESSGPSVDIMAERDANRITVSSASAASIGGVLFTFAYDGVAVGEPVLARPIPGMTIKSHAADGELRVLLMPSTDTGGTIAAGTNDLLTIPVDGSGNIELTKIEVAGAAGEALPGRIVAASAHPSSYALLQNYPNPFNAGTVIPFDLRDASEWELTIYNIMGQIVRTFNGLSAASRVEVTWDGTNQSGDQVASGMYFYRVRAGGFVASRKMILLK